MRILPLQAIRIYRIRYGLDAGLVLFVQRFQVGGNYGNLGRPEGFPPLPVQITMKWKFYPGGIPDEINPKDNSHPKKLSRRYSGPSTVNYRLLNYKSLGAPLVADFHRIIKNPHGRDTPVTYTRKKLLEEFGIRTGDKAPWFETPVDQMAWINLLYQDSQ